MVAAPMEKFSGPFKKIKTLYHVLHLDVLWKTIVEFGENTSFHGVKYIVSSRSSIFEKILWLGIVLSGVCGSIYMTMIFWNRYSDNPIRTTIQSSHKPTSSIPFPGVTICTAIRLVPKRLDDYLKIAKIPPTLNRKRIVDLLPYVILGYTQPINVNQSIVNELNPFFVQNGLKLQDVFSIVEPNLTDIFIKCKWKGKERPCEELFVKSKTKEGFCYTLKQMMIVNYVTGNTFYYGYQMGLSVIIRSVFGDLEQPILSSIQSVGAKVLIHDSKDYAGTSATEKILGNGTESFIRILGTRLMSSPEVEALTVEQRECLFSDEQPSAYSEDGYRDSYCELECKMNKIHKICNCVSFLYPDVPNKALCDLKDIPCLSTNFLKFYKEQSEAGHDCECLPQCNDFFFSVQTAGVPLRKVPYTASSFYENAGLEDSKNMTSSMIIHVFFGNHAQIMMLRDRITSTYYLLSSFGGVFSLFLGCSFISVLEILYFFCFRLFVHCKRSNTSTIIKH